MTGNEIAALIRKAAKEAGYDYYASYNDKHKDGSRRLKIMQNGFRHSANFKSDVLRHIKQTLLKHNADHIKVQWNVGMKWGCGEYDYIEAHIPADKA